MGLDPQALARELADARAHLAPVTPPSARDASFDLDAAYGVGDALMRARLDAGHHVVGYKVGFASKAVWRALGLETVVWGPMYEDSVRYAPDNSAHLGVAGFYPAKIEPEIVFKLKRPPTGDASDGAAVLAAVEWIALGFEIIDCPYPEWKFKPVDFVASYGLHAALVVGAPLEVSPDNIPALLEQLPRFTVALSKDGAVVAEGSGKNVMRNPALSVGELAAAMARRSTGAGLKSGDLVSSGTLTESQLMGQGQTWTARVGGLDLPELTLQT